MLGRQHQRRAQSPLFKQQIINEPGPYTGASSDVCSIAGRPAFAIVVPDMEMSLFNCSCWLTLLNYWLETDSGLSGFDTASTNNVEMKRCYVLLQAIFKGFSTDGRLTQTRVEAMPAMKHIWRKKNAKPVKIKKSSELLHGRVEWSLIRTQWG